MLVEAESIMKEIKNVLHKVDKLKLEELLSSATLLIDNNNKPVTNLLTSLDKTINNLDSTIDNVRNTLDNTNITIDNLNQLTGNESLQQIPSDVSLAIQELEETLKKFQTFTDSYSSESKFSAELSLTLKELTLAAESIERVSRKLEKKPNSLLLGDD